MNRLVVFLSIFVLAAVGCSSSPPAASSSGESFQAQGGGSDVSSTAAAPDPNADMPTIPPDAMYTLHCATFTGLTHIDDAKRVKLLLVRSTGSKDWYLVHESDSSDLYFGFYKTFDDRSQLADFNRAQSDKVRIGSMVNDQGDPLFPMVMFTSINTPDPPAPKAWDLSSNPGYWTLQIAVYKGSPLRKQMAVDAVKGFRAMGVEAYYRHGPATSEVYIGSWPREAVQEQEAASAEADDPDESLLVVPGPLPKGIDPNNLHDAQGRKVKVVMPQLVIQDESLKRVTQQYPNYYVNGVVAGHKVKMTDGTYQVVAWPSYLIQVPHDNQDDQDQTDKADLGQSPSQQQGGTDEPGSNVPGLGGLR
jgi:hypothetical protein